MQILRGIAATNELITLADGRREIIADEALENAARDITSGAGIPSCVEHDASRLIGWVNKAWTVRDGKSLHLVYESEIPETEAEHELLQQKYAKFAMRQVLGRSEPFHELIKSLHIPDLKVECDQDFVLLNAPNISKELFPAFWRDVDADGLSKLTSEWILKDQFLSDGTFVLIPSRFLRPSFWISNKTNRELVLALIQLAICEGSCNVRIAIDPDRVGILRSFNATQQREYWWGPKFTGRLDTQPYGMAVHGPTKYDSLNELVRTEFWWYGKSERTFEIEELHNRQCRLDQDGIAYGMRFVHSILDGENSPRHLDGAVRLYTADLFEERLKSKLTEFGKRAERIKLWRVDGNIPKENWYELIHMFFRGNYTIAEYFGFPSPGVYRKEFESRVNNIESKS